MSIFWARWVECLVVINLVITLILFVWGPQVAIPTLKDGTTGHTWAHGVLRESVRRLPTWWLLLSAGALTSSVIYLLLYPGFGDFQGLLQWTERGELAEDTRRNQIPYVAVMHRLAGASVEALSDDPEARNIGERLFIDNCAACHGRAAHGNPLLGAPNLTDDDWLYGGDGASILASIREGRHGVMPALGSAFTPATVEDLANYVRSLSGLPSDPVRAAAGKPLFAVCSACHGADGKGSMVIGAPNLTDTVWMYGSDVGTIMETITAGRGGVMPAWSSRLSLDDSRLIAGWVYAQSHVERAAHGH